jgi:hypothetical protein
MKNVNPRNKLRFKKKLPTASGLGRHSAAR